MECRQRPKLSESRLTTARLCASFNPMEPEMTVKRPAWPDIPYPAWQDTCTTLHLWTQIVGKVRLALTPWTNHSWHVPLYVTARGLGTSLIPDPRGGFELEFDFVSHVLSIRTAAGDDHTILLEPRSVADFHQAVLEGLEGLGHGLTIDGSPNEVADAVPFALDETHAAYDPEYARRFWEALVRMNAVFTAFRARFIGKCSPVHFFWGSFDLALTRFSGRTAPPHPGGFPNLPDVVTREAYSHEVSSAGFWPGGGPTDYAAFYSYAYPTPDGFGARPAAPAEAFFHDELGEFLLPYDAVRAADDPEDCLMQFLQSTYAAAADLGSWERAALERDRLP